MEYQEIDPGAALTGEAVMAQLGRQREHARLEAKAKVEQEAKEFWKRAYIAAIECEDAGPAKHEADVAYRDFMSTFYPDHAEG